MTAVTHILLTGKDDTKILVSVGFVFATRDEFKTYTKLFYQGDCEEANVAVWVKETPEQIFVKVKYGT